MQTVANQNLTPQATAAAHWPDQLFPPLEQESRSHVETARAAYHLNRQPQTMRSWASLETGPIRPIRISGRLAWPVAEIRALLNGGA